MSIAIFGWYKKIETSSLPSRVKNNFIAVFTSWMLQRFKDKDYKEVIKMFVPQTEFEETKFYKDVVKIGEKRGEKRGEKIGERRGLEGQISLIEQLRAKGIMDEQLFMEFKAPLEKRMAVLTKRKV